MIKIAVTADIHLGRNSTQAPPDFPASTRHILDRISDFCIREKVDVLIIAGDVIDRENRYFEAYQPLRKALEKWSAAGIHTYLVSGNHDFDSLPKMLEKIADDKVHFLGRAGQWEVVVYEKAGEKLQIAGWSFPDQYVAVSPLESWNPELLQKSIPVVGVVHGDFYDPGSPYAPLNHPALFTPEVQAWIFGHIHKPAVIHPADPLIMYPGSPQALSPKETGGHGITTLRVENGAVFREGFYQLSGVVYSDLEIHVPAGIKAEDLQNHVIGAFYQGIDRLRAKYEDRQWVVDVHLTGFNPNPSKIKEMLLRLSEEDGIVEGALVRKTDSSVLRSGFQDLESLSELHSIPGTVAKMIRSLETEGDLPGSVGEILAEVRQQAGQLKNASTYRGIAGEIGLDYTEDRFREMVLAESRRILSHFAEQLNVSGDGQ